jgi:hypothetical protein
LGTKVQIIPQISFSFLQYSHAINAIDLSIRPLEATITSKKEAHHSATMTDGVVQSLHHAITIINP